MNKVLPVTHVFFSILCAGLALFISSCASNKGEDVSAVSADVEPQSFHKDAAIGSDGGGIEEVRRESLRSRFGTTYKEATSQRDAEGKRVVKRSQFDKREQFTGVKSFGGKADRSRFEGKNWSGARDAQKQSFAGNTDGSRYKKRFRERGKNAREFGKSSKLRGESYSTNQFSTGRARERGGSVTNVADRGRSAYIGNRRNNVPDPKIYSLRDYQRRSISETRALMNRK